MLRNENLINGILCQLLLLKPWEKSNKSFKSIHYYLLLDVVHTTFDNGQHCLHYIFIPTTSNLKIKNKNWLKIDKNIWYQNKEVQLKLDELFILQEFDLKSWKAYGEDHICDFFPQLLIKGTFNEWKLEEKHLENIKLKLYYNLSLNKTMFFILDRESFQYNNNYFKKRLRSKYIYNTNAFIPEFNNDSNIFFKNILEKVNGIRVKKEFINNMDHINNYKKEHFNNPNDRNIESKIKEFEKYFKEK